jgi:hypothetical protein
VYRYSAANLTAIVPQPDQPVSTAGFTADFPANSITLIKIGPIQNFSEHVYLPLVVK